MSRPAEIIKAEAYREVADWLDEFAAKMKKDFEKNVFAPGLVHEPVLKASGVKGMATDLRKKADEIAAPKTAKRSKQ